MSEKTKNQAATINKPLFLAMWGGSYAAAWALLMLTSRILPGISDTTIMLLVTGLFMLIPVTQKLLLRYIAHMETRWWLRLSLVGYFIGAWLVTNLNSSFSSDGMMMAALFTPAGILQWFVLRGRVKSSWLWIGAAIVSGLVFMAIIPHNSPASDAEMMTWIAIGGMVQGIVTGMTMIALLANRVEKLKVAPVRLIS